MAELLTSVDNTDSLLKLDSPVGAVTVVGQDALIGHVVVSAVVISSNINSKIDAIATISDDKLTFLVGPKGASSPIIKISLGTREGRLVFNPAEVTYHPASLIMPFPVNAILSASDYVIASGFSPDSIESDPRLEDAVNSVSGVLEKKFTDIRMIRNIIPNFEGPSLASEIPSFPRSTAILTWEGIAGDAVQSKLQSALAIVMAEIVAASVRSVKILDLDEMYPGLGLASNFGYGCYDLYCKIKKYSSMLENDKFGGEKISRWIDKADKKFSGKSTKKSSIILGKVDAQGREIMDVDMNKAKKMADELSAKLTKKTQVAPVLRKVNKPSTRFDVERFVESIKSQIQRGRTLTPRQMYVLNNIYKKGG